MNDGNVPATLAAQPFGMHPHSTGSSPMRVAALDWVARPRQLVLRARADDSVHPRGRAEPTPFEIRGGRPDDGPALAAMHDRCSMETIFRRYLGAVPALSAAWQAQLLATTVALLAVDGTGAVRALGNVARLDHRGSAELAVLVEDAYQGRGLGTVLARNLAAAARLAGFRTVRMDMLPSSTAAVRTAAGLGPSVAVVGQGVVTLTMSLRVESLKGLVVA
jgi:GNAT superfamily N-acetyltransferase